MQQRFGSGSQVSLTTPSIRKEKEEGADDDDSLIVYNLDPGVDVSKFNEDGSFIGQYGKHRNFAGTRGGGEA